MIGLNSPTKAVLQNYGSEYTPVLQNSPNERNKQERQERLNVKLSCLSEHVRR